MTETEDTKQPYSIRLQPLEYAKIKAAAEELGSTFSQQARWVLIRWAEGRDGS